MSKIHSTEKIRRYESLKQVKTMFPSYTTHIIRRPIPSGKVYEERLDIETIVPVPKKVDGQVKNFLVNAVASIDVKNANDMVNPIQRFLEYCQDLQNSYVVTDDDWEHEEFNKERNSRTKVLDFKMGKA